MSVDRRLLTLLRPYTGLFVLAIAASALSAVFDGGVIVVLVPFLKHLFGTAGALAGATPLEGLVDRTIGPLFAGATRGGAALRAMALLGLALALKNGFGYLAQQTNVRIQESLVRDLRTRLFRHLQQVDLGFFQASRSGQVLNTLIQETDGAKVAVSAALVSLVQHAAVVMVTLAILAGISIRLTLLTLALAPLLLGGVRLLLRRLRRHVAARVEERAELTGLAAERLGAMKLIRASGTEPEEAERFARAAQQYRRRVIRVDRYHYLSGPVTEIFAGLVLVLVLWAATVPAIAGQPLGPEATIVFLLAALKTMSPLKHITQFPAHWAAATASASRVFALLDLPAVEAPKDGEREASFERAIEYEGVGFRYDGGPPVLQDVSFRIGKGEVVALVGPSGAGKTTIADLLPRFWDPTAGAITLDGVALTGISRQSLRSLVAVVGQDTMLLNDTVRANIAYGKSGASDQEVARAAEAANAAGFIERMAEGYDTVIGERGTRLSGGQRQRIAIARALLRDAPILILDEATSALDNESERLVQEAIDRLMADRTVLVIAHRLTTVRHADRILVVDGGRVVEQGSHDALLARNGLYRRLHDLQFLEHEGSVGVP